MDQTKHPMNETNDETFPPADENLTPPNGDELRSEETFGRTDRYANVDDEDADRTADVSDQS